MKCCHEFFLYITGHGKYKNDVEGIWIAPMAGVTIYEPSGSGWTPSRFGDPPFLHYNSDKMPRRSADGTLYYEPSQESLYYALSKFGDCVKIIVMIDSCYSGSAISPFDPKKDEIIPRKDFRYYQLPDLCPRDCGLTAITSTDVFSTAYAGGTVWDSFTDDLFDAKDKDVDGDGKKGDFGDMVKSAVKEGESWTVGTDPILFRCNNKDPLCSLDSVEY
jgi:hypothetical protein